MVYLTIGLLAVVIVFDINLLLNACYYFKCVIVDGCWTAGCLVLVFWRDRCFFFDFGLSVVCDLYFCEIWL